MLGTLGNPWNGSFAASCWALLLRFLFSEGDFASPDEAEVDTVSPVGRSFGPLERFLGLGLEDEYLLWWRPPFRAVTERPAGGLGAWVATDDSSDDAWGAAEATRRTESGSMAKFVLETSTDVQATFDRVVGGCLWMGGRSSRLLCRLRRAKSSVMRRWTRALARGARFALMPEARKIIQLGAGGDSTCSGVRRSDNLNC